MSAPRKRRRTGAWPGETRRSRAAATTSDKRSPRRAAPAPRRGTSDFERIGKKMKASGATATIRENRLLLLAIVSHEIELRARDGLELGRTLGAGKVVADAQYVTVQFVDRRESLAVVRPFCAGDGHSFRP